MRACSRSTASAVGTPSRRRRGPTAIRRNRVGALLCALTFLLQGCYETLPLQTGTAPPVAERVLFVLNDQGRVGLSSKLGPAVDKVEGTVLQVSENAYDISVTGITQVGGGSAMWNGERVSVGKDLVASYAVRRLNRTRTALLAGGVTVGAVLLIFGRSRLLGGGGVEPSPIPEPGPPSAVRAR